MIEALSTYIPPILKTYFLHPLVFFAFPFVFILLWAIIFWPKKHKKGIKHRKALGITIGLTRSLMLALVFITIATPFVQQERTISGEPTLRVLIDNSTSMQVFDTSFVDPLISDLKTRIQVEVSQTGGETRSTIGQDLIARTKTQDTVLVISDGVNTGGIDWGDVSILARGNNITMSTVELNANRNDHFVSILSPSKTTVGTETAIGIAIGSAGAREPVHVKLTIDDEVVVDETTTEDLISLTQTFDEGFHSLKAEITSEDHFEENNVAYRVIKATPRPRVAIVGAGEPPLTRIARQLYGVDTMSSIPSDLSQYHALILNDVPISRISSDAVQRLTDYVVDGNGLFVVGGDESYDLGGYKNSQFETLLPAFVGATETTGGASSVVIVIDISASTGYTLDSGDRSVDVEKALTVAAVDNVGPQNQLGIAAFNTAAFEVYPLRFNPNKEEIEEKVSRLYDWGGTAIDQGILQGLDMLKGAPGAKSIILVSDGRMKSPGKALSAAFLASDQGVRIYTVGIGQKTDVQVMKDIARVSHGTYFAATNSNRLELIFGDPEDLQADTGPRFARILDSNHFITQNVDIDAQVGGYNFVVPKSTAQLLASTNGGESLLVVWRIGLGRVASLATDDGSSFAGPLYSTRNSALLVRTMNWLIGSPDRLESRVIDVDNAYVGARTAVTVTADIPPSIPGFDFTKVGDRSYEGEFVPDTVGLDQIEDTVYAVNAPLEYQRTGQDPLLGTAAQSTGGLVVTPDQIDEIVDHVKTQSTRKIITKDAFRWPFVVAALILLLLELFIRRLAHHRLKKNIAYEAKK